MKRIFPVLFFVCIFVVACGEEKSTDNLVPVEQQSDEVASEKAVDVAQESVSEEASSQSSEETTQVEVSGESVDPEVSDSGAVFKEISASPVDEVPADVVPAAEIISNTAPAIAEKPAALKKCESCHTFDKDGARKVGPNMFGIFGKEAGKVHNFQYTRGFLRAFQGKVWDEGNLDAWITNSKKMAPKSKMGVKISKPEDRAAIISYMKGLK